MEAALSNKIAPNNKTIREFSIFPYQLTHHPNTHANMSGHTMVASLSTINLGV